MLALYTKEQEEFARDQQQGIPSRWSDATIRLAMCLYASRPSAFEKVKNMHMLLLPSSRTMQREMAARRPDAGDDNTLMRQSFEMYTAEQDRREKEWIVYEQQVAEAESAGEGAGAQLKPPDPRLTGEVILMFDEVGFLPIR